MNASLVVNQEHNGLELYFHEKPAESILAKLGSNKRWHYHRQKKCWYAKHTEENQTFAKQFLPGETGAASAIEAGTPFFPSYDHVGGTPIYRSSDLSCWDHHEGYFSDINAYVEVRPDRITIRDLREALVPGGECERLVLTQRDQFASSCLHDGLSTFGAVYEKFFAQRELPDCEVYSSTRKGSRVFTPFKEIKPIYTPAKWTLPHVWKAILAGQIFEGAVDAHYTDDYAYDAAVNYREGIVLHLPSFARKLIEEPSGWYVFPDKGKSDSKSIQLSVNCHGFDLNTLRFDESCDWAEVTRRRDQRTREQTEHNAALEMQLLSYDECAALAQPNGLYDVRYIKMNHNTDLYEEHPALLLGRSISDGERLLRDVVAVEPHVIRPDALYAIDCEEDLAQMDERVIRTSDEFIVSGMALREMLEAE